MEVKGFIFDLDGVLVDTAKYHFRSWQRISDSLGFSLDNKVAEQLKGSNRTASLEIVLDAGNIKATENEKTVLAKKKNNWYLDSLKNLDHSVVLPGVSDLLNQLANKGIPMAVGSASRNATIILERLGMSHYFRSIIDGNMVMRFKPDPEVFTSVARDLQLREDQCVIFEDSQKGIRAANEGGFRVIGIGSETHLNQANAVIPSLVDQNYQSILALLD